MPLATSNRVALRCLTETTYGVVNTAAAANELKMTGESLAFAIQTDSSKVIRSDRQTTDLIQVGASASGGLNFEMTYKEYDILMQAQFMDAWTVYGTGGVGAAVSLTIDTPGGIITWGTVATPVAPTGVDALLSLAVGQFFRLSAGADAAHGAILRIASRTTTSITVSTATPIPGTGSRVAAASTISSSRLVNGSTVRSFTLEKGMLDLVPTQFFAYRGMNASKLSMSFASGAIVTGSFDFMGKDSIRTTTTGFTGGSVIAPTTFDSVNAVSGVGTLLENGAAIPGTFIKSLKLDVDNKMRGQDAIGVLGFANILPGSIMVTGEMEIYLADGALYDKFVNNTSSSIVWTMRDGAGNGYAINLPKIKYSDAKVQAGGLDQDVMLSMPFTALMDTVTGKTIILDRFGVAA